MSPLLWKKVGPKLSAGRVQSVAVRLIVERERQRMAFHSATYWDLVATFATAGDRSFFRDAVDGRRQGPSRRQEFRSGHRQAHRRQSIAAG